MYQECHNLLGGPFVTFSPSAAVKKEVINFASPLPFQTFGRCGVSSKWISAGEESSLIFFAEHAPQKDL